MTSFRYWMSPPPTGITILPPGLSCSTSASSTRDARDGNEAVALHLAERCAHRGRHAGEAGFRARLCVQGVHLGDHARTQGRKILGMGFFNQQKPQKQAY